MKKDTKYKGLVKIGKKVYGCYVYNGVRYIDGKTVAEFIKTMSEKDLIETAITGKNITELERLSRKE